MLGSSNAVSGNVTETLRKASRYLSIFCIQKTVTERTLVITVRQYSSKRESFALFLKIHHLLHSFLHFIQWGQFNLIQQFCLQQIRHRYKIDYHIFPFISF